MSAALTWCGSPGPQTAQVSKHHNYRKDASLRSRTRPRRTAPRSNLPTCKLKTFPPLPCPLCVLATLRETLVRKSHRAIVREKPSPCAHIFKPQHTPTLSPLHLHFFARAIRTHSHARYRSRRQDAKRRTKKRPKKGIQLPTHPYPVPFASSLLCVRHWFENQTAQSSAQRRLAALVSAAQEDRPTFKPPHRPPLASRLKPLA